ncbi:MAG: hypothetical protein ACTSU5_11870 [Promethearchaeota archaeon]
MCWPPKVYIYSISEEGEIGPEKTVNITIMVYNTKPYTYHDLTLYVYSPDPLLAIPAAFVFDIGGREFMEFTFEVYINTTATEFNFQILGIVWEDKMIDFEEMRLTFNDVAGGTGLYNVSVYNEIYLNYTVDVNVNVTVEQYNEIINEMYLNFTNEIDVYNEIINDLNYTINNWNEINNTVHVNNTNLWDMYLNLSVLVAEYQSNETFRCNCNQQLNLTVAYPEGGAGMLKSGAYLLSAGFGLMLIRDGYNREQENKAAGNQKKGGRKPVRRIERMKLWWNSWDGPVKVGSALLIAVLTQLLFANVFYKMLDPGPGFNFEYGNEVYGLLVAGVVFTAIIGFHNWKAVPFTILLVGIFASLQFYSTIYLTLTCVVCVVYLGLNIFIRRYRQLEEYRRIDVSFGSI